MDRRAFLGALGGLPLVAVVQPKTEAACIGTLSDYSHGTMIVPGTFDCADFTWNDAKLEDGTVIAVWAPDEP